MDQQAKIKRLRAELKRVRRTRYFKKGHRILRQRVPVRYALIKAHLHEFAVRSMCRILQVHHSGFYAWVKHPKSPRQKENDRLLGLLSNSGWRAVAYMVTGKSTKIYAKSVNNAVNRVARLMKQAGLKAQVGYRKSRAKAGTPAIQADNHLKQQFSTDGPNKAWVTDITYIRTHKGWLYLSVVIDLFSRQVIGWAMKP